MNLQNRNKERRADRQAQAKFRAEAYEKLSTAEKLKLLPPDGSHRQRVRLEMKLQKEKA